jgi:hypothetical protein
MKGMVRSPDYYTIVVMKLQIFQVLFSNFMVSLTAVLYVDIEFGQKKLIERDKLVQQFLKCTIMLLLDNIIVT